MLYTEEISFYARLCRGHRIETVRFIGVFAGNRRHITKLLLLFPDLKTLYTTSKISSISTDDDEDLQHDDIGSTTLFEECSDDSPDDVDDSSHHLCSLRHLHLASARAAELEGLVNRPFPLQVDRLHSMHLAASEELAPTGDFLRDVARLIEAARSLVHLTLDLMEAPDLSLDHVDMPVLPLHRLTTVTLWIQSGLFNDNTLLYSPSPVNTCLFYVRSLSTSPAYPSCLDIAIRASRDAMSGHELVAWEDFADALMRPEFPRMRRVSFTVRSRARTWEEVYSVTPESHAAYSLASRVSDSFITLTGELSIVIESITSEDY
ncbi:hypothetical protein BDZ89DRAFT_779826 [Hymenopellis radicata]|nr:hypothetical protein BDZ89DRAFT_779826 [Hymenopellis radicata]